MSKHTTASRLLYSDGAADERVSKATLWRGSVASMPAMSKRWEMVQYALSSLWNLQKNQSTLVKLNQSLMKRKKDSEAPIYLN